MQQSKFSQPFTASDVASGDGNVCEEEFPDNNLAWWSKELILK